MLTEIFSRGNVGALSEIGEEGDVSELCAHFNPCAISCRLRRRDAVRRADAARVFSFGLNLSTALRAALQRSLQACCIAQHRSN